MSSSPAHPQHPSHPERNKRYIKAVERTAKQRTRGPGHCRWARNQKRLLNASLGPCEKILVPLDAEMFAGLAA